jgi:hypothetical protein
MSNESVRRVAERAALVLLSLPDDLHGIARKREIVFFAHDCVYDASPVDRHFADDRALRDALEARSALALRSALTLLAAIDPEAAGPIACDMIHAEASPDMLSAQTGAKGLLSAIATLPLDTVLDLVARPDLDGDAILEAYGRRAREAT